MKNVYFRYHNYDQTSNVSGKSKFTFSWIRFCDMQISLVIRGRYTFHRFGLQILNMVRLPVRLLNSPCIAKSTFKLMWRLQTYFPWVTITLKYASWIVKKQTLTIVKKRNLKSSLQSQNILFSYKWVVIDDEGNFFCVSHFLFELKLQQKMYFRR